MTRQLNSLSDKRICRKYWCFLAVFCLIASVTFDTQNSFARGDDSNLSLAQAREYMLGLINKDRATNKLPPVQLDEVASAAAQLHSDEMATKNFSSHWHADGRKPPQRYNDAGGLDYVAENSLGGHLDPPWTAAPAPNQFFKPRELDKIEHSFFHERPPNDGHRKNILDPAHTHVGIGLTVIDLQYNGTPNSQQTYCAEEFVSRYANFSTTKRIFDRSAPFVIDAELNPSVQIYGVSVFREDLPTNIKLSALQNNRLPEFHGGYTIATEHITSVFPAPFRPSPNGSLTLEKGHLHCEITPAEDWKSGLYYIYVYGKPPSGGDPFPISLITVPFEGSSGAK
jgi:uncharacterized protein YkwD